MGLDMYVRHGVAKEDESYESWKRRQLCYWRKHPNLHGFIVETFADGIDECQEIPLTQDDVRKILAASEADELPHTEGFFFGTSMPEDKEDTHAQLTALLKWMAANPKARVYYQASW